MCTHATFECIIPPHLLERLARNPDPAVSGPAIRALQLSAAFRSMREAAPLKSSQFGMLSAGGTKDRVIHDMENKAQWYLPGEIVRREGDPNSGDAAVDEAFDFSGQVYDFFWQVLGRNSLDDQGMLLRSSVHVGTNYGNAFWNGQQMAYGDGDGIVFQRFTASLDVVAHELTHGVVTHTSNLQYVDEPGALNEHFADAFGIMVRHWVLGRPESIDDWMVGNEVLVPRETAKGIRCMGPHPAFSDDPFLGDDDQPKHIRDKYNGDADHGGVHINSGIPNHAFFIAATTLGGDYWDQLAPVWYDTLRALHRTSDFSDMVRETLARSSGSVQEAIRAGWKAVGLIP